jgi:high-affinity nickel permease
MFGLDDKIAGMSNGASLAIVIAVAVLLGLRHASDPDHLAAVTTLAASGRDRVRGAALLGSAWGLGHATSLFALGVPIVLFKAYLPETAERIAETLIGLVIVALAIWLLVRWRRGLFHLHVHAHASSHHVHGHVHGSGEKGHAHGAPLRARSPLQAYAIGVLHGIGGSAGVGVLLLAAIHDHAVALVALALFAVCTAISMAALSTGFGLTLSSAPVRRSFARIAPVLGMISLLFGLWYALGAQGLAPYYF